MIVSSKPSRTAPVGRSGRGTRHRCVRSTGTSLLRVTRAFGSLRSFSELTLRPRPRLPLGFLGRFFRRRTSSSNSWTRACSFAFSSRSFALTLRNRVKASDDVLQPGSQSRSQLLLELHGRACRRHVSFCQLTPALRKISFSHRPNAIEEIRLFFMATDLDQKA